MADFRHKKTSNDRVGAHTTHAEDSVIKYSLLRWAGLAALFLVSASHASRVHTPASLNVDLEGNADHAIAIEVPPGTAGLSPALSLNYSSGGANGLLGMGWQISGLSSISRCPATQVTDGAIWGVKLDTNDRFCLDGKRLMVWGSGTYGANGTEYRTEAETYSKVISNGTAGNGPAWFQVWSQDGLILEYGNTADSRIEAKGLTTVRSWALNKVSDRKGNYYTITYAEDATTGEYYPAQIDYTGNAAASLATYNSVQFTFATRADVESYAVGSVSIQRDKRLTNIKTFNGVNLVKDYRIAYETAPSTGRSRVISLTECAGDGSCLPPTTYGWRNGGGGISSQSGATPTALGASAATITSLTKGDFNGDGNMDVLERQSDGQSRICYGPALTTCTGYWNHGSGTKIAVGDFNGDGRSDIVSANPNGDLRICHGPNVPPVTTCTLIHPGTWVHVFELLVGDFNGDGRDDLLLYRLAVNTDLYFYDVYAAINNGAGLVRTGPNGNFKPYRGDFDGDGTQDVLFVGSLSQAPSTPIYIICTGIQIATATFTCPTVTLTENWRDTFDILLADVNGDGKKDLLLVTPTGLRYCAGPNFLGSNNCQQVANTSWDWKSAYQAVAEDFNGDGAADLVLAGTNEAYFCPGPGIASNNNCFQISTATWRNWQLLAADFNGNAAADLFLAPAIAGDLGTNWIAGGAGFPDIMTSMIDGLGSVSSLVFKPITDATVYTKGTAAAYPNQDIQTPLHVVSSASRDDGIGGSRTTTYSYERAKYHLLGRGKLGFEFVKTTDQASGLETWITKNLEFPHSGRVTEVQVKTPAGAVVARQVKTVLPVGPTTVGRQRSAMTARIEASYGLDGIWSSRKETFGYNDYGNLQVHYEYWDENASSPRKLTVKTTGADIANWLISRVDMAEIKFWAAPANPWWSGTVDGGTKTYYTFVPGTNLVAQSTKEPGDANNKVITDYTWNAFGNMLSATVSGPSITTRTSSWSYDARGRFAVGETNALSQSSSAAFDERFGERTSATDANALTTTWTLDAFGRRLTETRPDGTQTTFGFALCGGGCPTLESNAPSRYYQSETSTGFAQPKYQWFDALNRTVGTSRSNFAGTDWQDENIVSFDAAGRRTREYLSHFRGSSVKPYASLTYDASGRVVTSTKPGSGSTTHTYSQASPTSPVSHAATNSLGQVTTTERNILGRIISVKDARNNVTTYTYSGMGNVLTVTPPIGGATSYTYDYYGRKTAMSEPNLGSWSWTYDALGQQVSQTDAKAQVTTFTYDKLGRRTQRTEPSITATWTWDAATKGVGKLAASSATGSVNRAYIYDAYGRPSTQTVTVDSVAYSTTTGYDLAGRPETITYPSGFAARNVYNADGYLSEVRDNVSNALFWKAVAASAAGVTDEDFGNGTGVARNFDANTYLVSQIATVRDSDSTILQNHTFGYDALGNVVSRAETNQGVSETFGYDNLNRLTTVTGPAPKSYTYSEMGNILSKSDAGTYTYPPTGKVHAVSSVGANSYTYDANGNMLTGAGRTITWKSFNMPASIQVGSSAFSWTYDADLRRVKHVAPAETTIYVGSGNGVLYEKVVKPSVTEQKHLILANGKTVAQFTQRSVGSNDTRYLYRDHLGSTTLILDEAGVPAERLSYDAQGKRRFPTGPDDTASTLNGIVTERGFTGHEHLDELALVHMNGRIYDPKIGRMISPDPVYQDIAEPQSFNRYSYVLNNPLRIVDPTGYLPVRRLRPTEPGDDDTGVPDPRSKDGDQKPRNPTSICPANESSCFAGGVPPGGGGNGNGDSAGGVGPNGPGRDFCEPFYGPCPPGTERLPYDLFACTSSCLRDRDAATIGVVGGIVSGFGYMGYVGPAGALGGALALGWGVGTAFAYCPFFECGTILTRPPQTRLCWEPVRGTHPCM